LLSRLFLLVIFSAEFLRVVGLQIASSLLFGCGSSTLLYREPNRLAPDPCVPDSFQLASEQTADSAGRSVNGGKQIWVLFLDRHAAEGQDFRANAALAPSRAIVSYAYGDLAHTRPEAAEPKSQPPLDVGIESLSQINVVHVHHNVHLRPPRSVSCFYLHSTDDDLLRKVDKS